MNNKIISLFGIYLAGLLLLVSALPAANESVMKLWYTRPASEWVEALPIGNGRLGAMIYGGVANEKIQFNEETYGLVNHTPIIMKGH